MALNVFTVVIDCTDPRLLAGFWAEVLSCDARERNTDEYLVSDPNGKAFPLYFMKVPEPKVGKNRFHLDLVTDGSMSEEVDRLVKLGARLVDVRQDDAETYDKSRHVDSVRGLGGQRVLRDQFNDPGGMDISGRSESAHNIPKHVLLGPAALISPRVAGRQGS